MFRAFIIKVDPEKDLTDVLRIALTLGRVTFRTEKKLKVVKVYGPDSAFGYVAVVMCPQAESRSNSVDVSRKKD